MAKNPDQKEKRDPLMQEFHETKNAIKENLLTLVVAAFTLVAALAWNDAVRSLVKIIFPQGNGGIISKFVYSIIVTIIVAVISLRLRKIASKK